MKGKVSGKTVDHSVNDSCLRDRREEAGKVLIENGPVGFVWQVSEEIVNDTKKKLKIGLIETARVANG